MPIEKEAFYSMLGIAMRAGALTLGTDGVLAEIAAKRTAIVLLDEEISTYIQQLCDGNDYSGLKKVKTLDDLLLHTRYFGRKYEDRRQEFVSCLSSYLACKFEF